MENPRTKWWFIAGKIIYFYGPVSMGKWWFAIGEDIDYQMVQVRGRRICDEAARTKSAGANVSWVIVNDQ